jgi:hypothetical protein
MGGFYDKKKILSRKKPGIKGSNFRAWMNCRERGF